MTIVLKGMTWSHPRGHDPLVACSRAWLERTGVSIEWDKRSLQDFESYPVEELARRYDLIIIDHPHVGQVVAENCLLPLDTAERRADCHALARRAVGCSYDSYVFAGRLWALPVDTATQVQAWVPGRIGGPVRDWDDMMQLSAAGRVAWPLRPPHSLMSFFSLAAHLGLACNPVAPPLTTTKAVEEVLPRLQALYDRIDPQCLEADPIAVYEAMAEPGSPIACVPLIYGYANYAADGFRATRIGFADIPVIGGRPPAGTTLGGTYCDEAFHGPDLGNWSLLCVADPPGVLSDEDPSVRSARLRSQAFAYAREHLDRLPVVVAARLGRSVDLFGLDRLVDQDEGEERYRWASWAGIVAWWVLAPLAVIGVRRIDRVSRRLLLVPVVTVWITTVLFYGAHRIRSPLEPTVVVGAAVAIATWSATRWRSRASADTGDVA